MNITFEITLPVIQLIYKCINIFNLMFININFNLLLTWMFTVNNGIAILKIAKTLKENFSIFWERNWEIQTSLGKSQDFDRQDFIVWKREFYSDGFLRDKPEWKFIILTVAFKVLFLRASAFRVNNQSFSVTWVSKKIDTIDLENIFTLASIAILRVLRS